MELLGGQIDDPCGVTRFIQPAVSMKIGDASVVLRNVQIVPTRVNAGLDLLFGNFFQEGSEVSGVAEVQVKIVDDDEPAGGGLSAGRRCCQ